MDNSARFRACIVADRDCVIDVSAMVEQWEKEGKPLASTMVMDRCGFSCSPRMRAKAFYWWVYHVSCRGCLALLLTLGKRSIGHAHDESGSATHRSAMAALEVHSALLQSSSFAMTNDVLKTGSTRQIGQVDFIPRNLLTLETTKKVLAIIECSHINGSMLIPQRDGSVAKQPKSFSCSNTLSD